MPGALIDTRFARRQVAGGLLVVMIAFAVLHGVAVQVPAWPAGAAGWLAAVLLGPDLTRGQRFQVGVLIVLGVAALAGSDQLGVRIEWVDVVDQNHGLLAMLAAVSFLRLVSMPAHRQPESPPRGAHAYLRTLLGIHLFGAAINLSAVTIIGDRLTRSASERRTATLISRGFSAAALWSPFFAGMAVVLTYAPGARLPTLIAIGVFLASCGLAFTFAEAVRADPRRLAAFDGYPIHFDSLWVPGLLAGGVLLTHWVVPYWPVLTVITLLAPALTGAALVLRHGHHTARSGLLTHVRDELPEMVGELWLFLAAGVLAVGLGRLFAGLDGGLPFAEFTAGVAVATLVAGVGLAAVGVHPVITVSALAGWLAPVDPDPTLLALVFLMTWSVGVALSPLSATHLTLQGRYGVAAARLVRWNFSYGVFMLALGAVVLVAYANGG